MTYLASSAGALITDRNTWQSRANQAYDGGAWGSGNLWSADAHNDPNVWTNRYNTGYSDGNAAGYAAGAAAAQPPAAVDRVTTSAAIPTGADGWAQVATRNADRNGQWIVIGWCSAGSVFTGARLRVNGVQVGHTSGAFNQPVNNGSPYAMVFWQGALVTSDTVAVDAYRGSAGGATVGIDMYFLPTQATPH